MSPDPTPVQSDLNPSSSQTRNLSLTFLSRPPLQKPDGKAPLLLLLHGVGSHEGDLMTLAPYLDGRLFIASARGPRTLAPGSYAYYHVEFTPSGSVINAEEAESSLLLLLKFVDELVQAYDLDPDRVYVMGFSQGAIMSLSLGLTAPERLAGVAAMNGRILPEVLPDMAPREQLQGLHVFIAHGIHDATLSIQYAREARDLLSALPVDLTYREYPAGHQITAEGLADVSGWLTRLLDASEKGPRR